MNPGERGQVTQIREGIDDEFTLADLNMEFGLGGVTLTSVTSYTDRDVVVVRDAIAADRQRLDHVRQLSGGDPATSAEVRLNSPLIDTTQLKTFSQEVRLASDGGGAFEWLVGAFYQDIDRDYGQNLPTPGYDAFLTRAACRPARASTRRRTRRTSRRCRTTSSSSRCSAKAPIASAISGA